MSDSPTLKAAPTLADLRSMRDAILEIARRNKAYNVRVFGSVARGDATPDSDIDFLVDFEPKASLYDLSGLRLDLIELLGREVDILSDHDKMRQRLRDAIHKDMVIL